VCDLAPLHKSSNYLSLSLPVGVASVLASCYLTSGGAASVMP